MSRSRARPSSPRKCRLRVARSFPAGAGTSRSSSISCGWSAPPASSPPVADPTVRDLEGGPGGGAGDGRARADGDRSVEHAGHHLPEALGLLRGALARGGVLVTGGGHEGLFELREDVPGVSADGRHGDLVARFESRALPVKAGCSTTELHQERRLGGRNRTGALPVPSRLLLPLSYSKRPAQHRRKRRRLYMPKVHVAARCGTTPDRVFVGQLANRAGGVPRGERRQHRGERPRRSGVLGGEPGGERIGGEVGGEVAHLSAPSAFTRVRRVTRSPSVRGRRSRRSIWYATTPPCLRCGPCAFLLPGWPRRSPLRS